MQPVFFCAKINKMDLLSSMNQSCLLQSAANLRADNSTNDHLNQVADNKRQNTYTNA